MALDSWMPLTSQLASWEDKKAKLPAQCKPRQGGTWGDPRGRATACLASQEAQKTNQSVVRRNGSSLGPAALSSDQGVLP